MCLAKGDEAVSEYVQAEVNGKGLGGVVAAGKHHAVEELPNTKVVAGNQVRACPCSLSALRQHSHDFFVLSNVELFHQLEDRVTSHYLSQTCDLSLFVLVLSKEDLPIDSVKDYP